MSAVRVSMIACVVGALLTWSAGCGPEPKKADKEKADRTEKDRGHDHDHHEPGPHGGVVVDWGKYHAEVCFDRKKKEATVYVLGTDEKSPAPVKTDKLTLSIKDKEPFQVELKASPQKGDPEGASSRFVGGDERLGKEGRFEGTVMGVLAKKPYSKEFKEEAKK